MCQSAGRLAAVAFFVFFSGASHALFCPQANLAKSLITAQGQFTYSFVGQCSISEGPNAYTLIESGSGTWDGSGTATELFLAMQEGTNKKILRANITYACSANPWGDNTASCKVTSCKPALSQDGGKSFFTPGPGGTDGCKSKALGKAQPTTRFMVPVNQPLAPSHPSAFEFKAPAQGSELSGEVCIDLRLAKGILEKLSLIPDQNQVFTQYATLSWLQPDGKPSAHSAMPKELQMKGNASSELIGQRCVKLPGPALPMAGMWTIRGCLNKVALKNTTAQFSGCAERQVRVNIKRIQDAPPTGPARAAPQLPSGSQWPPLPGTGQSGRGGSSAPDAARSVPPAVELRTAPAAPQRAAPPARQPAATEEAVRADPRAPVRSQPQPDRTVPSRVPAQ